MALTHAEIVTQVEEDTGRTDKTTQIGNYVNRGQNVIVRDASQMHHDFSCLKKERYTDTVDGTKTYGFPSDLKSFYDLRLGGYYDEDEEEWTYGRAGKMTPLTPMYQDSVRPYPERDSEGKPVHYIPWGRFFELSPIPDAIYRIYIRLLIYPSTMATGDTSDLLYMDEVLIKVADLLTVLSLNLEKDIRRFRSEYEELLKATIASDREAHKYDTTLHVTPFVGGRTVLQPGEATEYWLKPDWIRSPG